MKDNLLVGSGEPFVNQWVKLKPDTINLTELWSTDFRYGYGLIPTYFVKNGLLGVLSWLAFLLTFIYLGFNNLFKKFNSNESKFILVSSFLASLYLWIMSFIYIPSYTNLFLTFLFSSIFIGSLYREKILGIAEFSISKSPKYGFVYIFLIVVILLGSIFIGYNLIEKLVANVYQRQGLISIQQNNFDLAQERISASITFDQNDISLRNLSEIFQVRALQAQNNQNIPESDRIISFENNIAQSIRLASAAVEYDKTNYNNFYYLGNLFAGLTSLEIDGISDQAINFMNQARELNPKDPRIPLALARIYFSTDNLEKAKELINQALEIKSNYTDAVYLLSRINVLEGEIEKAIENVRLTTLVRPNDPVTFFQLGLLQYQDNNFQSAVSSFESALIRSPFYANAKYFLGLSYYEVNRRQDAIKQFNDLMQLNPNNEEVRFILQNLQGGNPPFFGSDIVDPPINDEPENRDEPPIEESAEAELETEDLTEEEFQSVEQVEIE